MTAALALGVSLAATLLSWAMGAVSASGALAALLVGATVLGLLGWTGGAVLAAFFVPSTVAGRLGARRSSSSDARGERRDAIQVLANGGAATLGCCATLLAPELGLWILTGALATAAADTWATSLGALSSREPRHLLRGQRVPRGTSGAVSLIGTLGAVVGAMLVAGTAAWLSRSYRIGLVGFLVGVGGMLLDSLLGATVQGRFYCPQCRANSERRRHRCGSPTELTGGWRWLDNDGVNALVTTAGGLGAALCWVLVNR